MSSYQKATGTRIWQDEETSVEHEVPISFLWDMVAAVEQENGSDVQWRNTAAKTLLRLADGTCMVVIGSFKRWNDRWDRYLCKSEQRTLLFEN